MYVAEACVVNADIVVPHVAVVGDTATLHIAGPAGPAAAEVVVVVVVVAHGREPHHREVVAMRIDCAVATHFEAEVGGSDHDVVGP